MACEPKISTIWPFKKKCFTKVKINLQKIKLIHGILN